MATIRHVTLTAATVATVTLPVNAGQVEVTMKAATPGEVYLTTDGSTPTVAGNDCAFLAGVAGASVLLIDETGSATQTVVKAISSGTPSLAVRAL